MRAMPYGRSRAERRRMSAAALLLLVVLALLASACDQAPSRPGSPASPSRPTPAALPRVDGRPAAEPAAVREFNKHAHSVTRANSLWVIVNKKHPLDPIRYQPRVSIVDGHQVDHRMAPKLRQLLAGSRRAGNPLHVVSGYRSYGYQHSVFGGLAAQEGKASAEMWSAKPGYSEHQTGLAADLDLANSSTCSLQSCFGKTRGGRWLATNAWRYGFVIRYTRANTSITGYKPEPWHIRYVGKPLARELHATHATSLESFFGVTGGK